MVQKIKIYGERNSGTNYLHELIKMNLNVELLRGVAPGHIQILEHVTPGSESTRDSYFDKSFSENFGWKHSRADLTQLLALGESAKNVGFVCLVKNPYSWLLSFYQSPHHYEGRTFESFFEFVNSSLPVLNRDRMDSKCASPIELWNQKNQSYSDLLKHFQGVLFKYEDLLENPERAIRSIMDKLGITTGIEFMNYKKSTKSNADRDFNYYREYYLNEEWKNELNPELIDSINSQLNAEVMNKLGYSFL